MAKHTTYLPFSVRAVQLKLRGCTHANHVAGLVYRLQAQHTMVCDLLSTECSCIGSAGPRERHLQSNSIHFKLYTCECQVSGMKLLHEMQPCIDAARQGAYACPYLSMTGPIPPAGLQHTEDLGQASVPSARIETYAMHARQPWASRRPCVFMPCETNAVHVP